MMFKGNFKDKLLSLFFLLIAIGITFFIYNDAKQTREEIAVPVLSRDIKVGELIRKEDIGTTIIGKYKMDTNIIKAEDELIGKYAIKDMYKGRFFYNQDISNVKPPTEIREKIVNGAIAVETDLVKCVGGIPKEGDYVKVNIVKKSDYDNSIMEVIQYPELERLKILDIKNSSSESLNTEEQKSNTSLGNSSTQAKPALVIFDVTKEQEKKLLFGQYTGNLHLVLLPKEETEVATTKVNEETITNTNTEKTEVVEEDKIEKPKDNTQTKPVESQTQTNTNTNKSSDEFRQPPKTDTPGIVIEEVEEFEINN